MIGINIDDHALMRIIKSGHPVPWVRAILAPDLSNNALAESCDFENYPVSFNIALEPDLVTNLDVHLSRSFLCLSPVFYIQYTP